MKYADLLAQAEQKYGLPEGLLHAQMMAESNGDPNAVSPVGAKGLMQFMPATAKEYGIDPLVPEQAIDGAGRYMKTLLSSTGNVRDAVGAYNWGIGNVKRKGMNNAPEETRNYIDKVTNHMKQFKNNTTAVKPAEDLNALWDSAQPVKQQPAGEDINALWDSAKPAQQAKKRGTMSELARQTLGLPARDIIESGASTVGIFSDPLASLSNKFLGTEFNPASDQGKWVADSLGLPSPENATERVVNEGAKFLVPTAGIIKGADVATKGATGVTKNVLKSLASRADLQGASAVGAGLAGETAKENGAGFGGQLASTVAGGLALPSLVSLLKGGSNAITGMSKSIAPDRIDQAIVQSGIDLKGMTTGAINALRADVESALKIAPEISGDALRRLADYRQTGLTPMKSNLTLDPAQITQEQNLMKRSANSNDPSVNQLAINRSNNNKQLINNLNELGANPPKDAFGAGQVLMDAIGGVNSKVKGAVDNLYTKARATNGRSAELDPSTFTNRANDLLDEALLGGKLPSDVRNIINSISQGKTPFTVDVAEQLKTRIGDLQRATNDRAEKMALGQVRQALEETPLRQGQEVGKESIDAFNKARRVHAKWMGVVDRTPALKAIRDGVEPDKFVDKFIIRSNNSVADLEQLSRVVKNMPEANDMIRGQIMAYMKSKALNQNMNNMSDEIGTFSQSNFNKALGDIGLRKLSVFFTPEEISQLRAIGRVASYETHQGAGSAVNNSNTASAISERAMGLLDKFVNSNIIRSKIPFSPLIGNPVQDQMLTIGAKNASNVPKAIGRNADKVKKPNFMPLGAIPALSQESSN
jgi:hypothetical protein